MSTSKVNITIEADIQAPLEKVWAFWTGPEHIVQWNNASEDWHTVKADNDLRVGGQFSSRMEARDGSFGFDFWGVYDQVAEHSHIAYTLGDDRKVSVQFDSDGTTTHITETFEAEAENPPEMQKYGWQSILNNFKAYCESH